MSDIELKVQGMSCASCVNHVSAALSPLPGVTAVEVDLQAGRVRVSGTPDPAALLAVLDAAGYPAQLAATAAAATGNSAGCGSRCGCH